MVFLKKLQSTTENFVFGPIPKLKLKQKEALFKVLHKGSTDYKKDKALDPT